MLRVYVGYDPRDDAAFRVCERSMRFNSRFPGKIQIIPLKVWELRARKLFWRSYHVDPTGQMHDDRDGKPFGTDFSFTRFLVPALEGYGSDPVVFCDPDMLFRADVFDLVEKLPGRAGVACVKHTHEPPETTKGVGVQTRYARKNWSSLMVMRPSLCRDLTLYAVNNWTGSQLHQMTWIGDERIADLPESWNWLCGWSSPEIDPDVVHFTRGTPDMEGYEDEPFADEWRSFLKEPLEWQSKAS